MARQKKTDLLPEGELMEETGAAGMTLGESSEGEPPTEEAETQMETISLEDGDLAVEMEKLRRQNETLVEQMEIMKEQLQKQSVPTVVQVSAETERVRFLWQAEVANENIKTFGEGGMFGRIVGKTGSFYVPKSDLARVMDAENRLFLDKRWLIVVSGLDEEEREALGVDYKEGELLDKNAFARMVELGDELVELYGELCAGHKEMVARRYGEAFAQGSPYVTRDRVLRLSEMSKAAEMEPNPFQWIIEGMNERDAGK